MDEVELKNAMRLIKDYCDSNVICKNCIISMQCELSWSSSKNDYSSPPCGWQIEVLNKK